jgi:chromate transport protein ChrA
MIAGVKETVKEAITEMVGDAIAGLVASLLNAAYVITLVGGTICVILYVAGWEKGMRCTGIMFVGWVILRAVLGGV